MVVSSLFQVSSKSTTRGFKDIVQLPLQTAGRGKEDNQSIAIKTKNLRSYYSYTTMTKYMKNDHTVNDRTRDAISYDADARNIKSK